MQTCMKPKIKLKLVAVAVMAMMVQSPAHAVIGFGDISFDPTVYGELISLYEQTKQLYDTAKKQQQSLEDIKKTISQANQAYDSVVNGDLLKLSSQRNTITNPNDRNRYSAMRGELARTQGGTDSPYHQYQQERMKNLESLELLQRANTSNTERAAGKVNAATSAQITAQSTSALAALAASEQQRRVQEEFAMAKAQKNEVNNLQSSGSLYRALGSQRQTKP